MTKLKDNIQPLTAPICGSAAFWSLHSLRSGDMPPEAVLKTIEHVRTESLTDIAQGSIGETRDDRHKYLEASQAEIIELNDFLAKALQQIAGGL